MLIKKGFWVMAKLPIIGISCGNQAADGAIVLKDTYQKALARAGAACVLLPPAAPQQVGALLGLVDGLLLSGGGDLHPHFWGEEARATAGSVDWQRDLWELALVREAVRQKLPVLGICRGMQVINVALGGSLYQSLPSSFLQHWQTAPVGQVWHRVTVAQAMWQGAFPEAEIWVNSHHRQGVERLAAGLLCAARSSDGLIEAVGSADLQIFGIQWHAELLMEQTAVFENFIHKIEG